jgi:3-hydroxyisobutyrate dehydrogenase-like beta-hydroxyacid dehydrogenase
MAMKVGFIGLGNMGAAAARNVARAGHELFVFDIRREAGTPLEAEGATWCATPASMVGQVDVVMSMVFGPAQIEQVVRGTGGLLEGDCRGITGDVCAESTRNTTRPRVYGPWTNHAVRKKPHAIAHKLY